MAHLYHTGTEERASADLDSAVCNLLTVKKTQRNVGDVPNITVLRKASKRGVGVSGAPVFVSTNSTTCFHSWQTSS